MSVLPAPPRPSEHDAADPDRTQQAGSWTGRDSRLGLNGQLCSRTVEQIEELLSSGLPLQRLSVQVDGVRLSQASFALLVRTVSRLPDTCRTVQISGLDEAAARRVAGHVTGSGSAGHGYRRGHAGAARPADRAVATAGRGRHGLGGCRSDGPGQAGAGEFA